MRSPVQTRFWLLIVSSIVLELIVFSSPIRNPKSPNSRVSTGLPCRNFALVSNDSKSALMSAMPDRASVDVDYSDREEKDEDEFFWQFSQLVSSTSIPLDPPLKLLSGARPGDSPSETITVPLRC